MRERSIVVVVVVVMSTVGTASAFACPYNPVPTFKSMIRDGSTDVEGFPLLLLGRAQAVRDLRGGPNGDAIARFRVAEDAIGRVPRLVRVRFYRPKPIDGDVNTVTPYATLERGERWALVSRRRSDGVVRYAQICGPSRELGQERLRVLVRLARRCQRRSKTVQESPVENRAPHEAPSCAMTSLPLPLSR